MKLWKQLKNNILLLIIVRRPAPGQLPLPTCCPASPPSYRQPQAAASSRPAPAPCLPSTGPPARSRSRFRRRVLCTPAHGITHHYPGDCLLPCHLCSAFLSAKHSQLVPGSSRCFGNQPINRERIRGTSFREGLFLQISVV